MRASVPNLPEEYNLDFLKRIAGDNSAILRSLLEPFVRSATDNRHMLQQALDSNNRQLASEAAHKLAPKIRSIGLANLAETFAHIDKQHEVLHQNGEWTLLVRNSLLQLDAVIQAVNADLESLS